MLVTNSSKKILQAKQNTPAGWVVSQSLLQRQDGVIGRIMGPQGCPCPDPPEPEAVLTYVAKGTFQCD